jgi:FixJ family two-component response regulator
MNLSGFSSAHSHEAVARREVQATPVVYVVDDDVSVRESLELLIRSNGWRPETFESGQEFLSHRRDLVPSCLLLDYKLPDISGLALQQRLVAARIEMPVIFITCYGAVPVVVEAMKAGAVEFLSKPCDNNLLLAAMTQAIESSRKALARQAALRMLAARHGLLTRRERQVMQLVVSGKTNRAVGVEMSISEITVKAHRGSVMRKMQALSLVELVRMAAELHAAEGPPGSPSPTL